MAVSGSLIVGVPGCPDGPGVAEERSIAAQNTSFRYIMQCSKKMHGREVFLERRGYRSQEELKRVVWQFVVVAVIRGSSHASRGDEGGRKEGEEKYIYREVALGRIESDSEASTHEKPQASQAHS